MAEPADRDAPGASPSGAACTPAAAPSPAAWWAEVRASSLVGTGRRPAPAEGPLPVAPRPGADPQTRLLDQIALGAAWRAAGPVAERVPVPEPSPPDTRPVAPARAAQLLDLAFTQPGLRRNALVRHWASECAAAGYRAPAAVLPRLLDLATTDNGVADDVVRCMGARGRWLAEQSDRQRRLLRRLDPDSAPITELPQGWLQRPVGEQLALLTALHGRDPAAARAAVGEVFAGAAAKDRTAYLGCLGPHLGPDDEVLLDAALDDRAASVRDTAMLLLSRLPGSARSRRMTARLRALVHVSRSITGTRITIDLPAEPDAAGVRDGLGDPPGGRSRREHHLRTVVTGTPLPTWVELTGLPPAKLVGRLPDEHHVLDALRVAAVAQGDAEWALALLGDTRVGLREDLVAVLPPQRLEAFARERLNRLPPRSRLPLLELVPGPWSPELSDLAVAVLSGHGLTVGGLQSAVERLAGAMHPAAAGSLRAWTERLPYDDPLRRPLANLLAHITLRQSISEAFR